MNEHNLEFEQFIFHASDLLLEEQQLRLQEKWRLRLTDEMVCLVGRCLEMLSNTLQSYVSEPLVQQYVDKVKIYLARGFIEISNNHTKTCQKLMQEMVRKESSNCWEILTVSGLADQGGSMTFEPPLFSDDEIDEMACCREMEQVTTKSTLNFIQILYKAIDKWIPDQNSPQIVEELSSNMQAWMGRLNTIVRTLLHESFTRTMDKILAGIL